MGLFDKKYCDICGDKIGLLGNKKLEDGNMCKACASKLSPWFYERKNSTVEEIGEQLAYREQNLKKLDEFNTTKSLGRNDRVCLDEDNMKFLVTRGRNIKEENPDILDYSQVTGCDLDIEEYKDEIMRKNSDGEEVSYNPPRYSYSYDFFMTVFVNHPYFNKMRFKINASRIYADDTNSSMRGNRSYDPGKVNLEYREHEMIGKEIKKALTEVRKEAREKIENEKAPKIAVTCPVCGATTIPDDAGCCEYCGRSVNTVC